MRLLFIGLILLTACQTQSGSREAVEPKNWLTLRDSRMAYTGQEAYASGDRKLDPMLLAAQNLEWDKLKLLAEQNLQKYPGNKDSLLLLSLAYAGQTQYETAKFYAQLVLKAQANQAFALNLMGVIAKQTAILPEDNRRALLYFQLASQAANKSAVAPLNAAYLNLEIGRFQEARNDFKVARARCEDCLESLTGSAVANQALGLFDDAKGDIAAILERDPENPTAQLLLVAQKFYLNQEEKESRETLAKLLESNRGGSEFQKEVRVLLNRVENLAH